MTTLYIEEVTEEDGSEYHENSSNNVVDVEPKLSASSVQGNQEKIEIENLPSCPSPIAGGASLAIIGNKVFIFGGCSRSGIPSGMLRCFDLATREWDCHLKCKGTPPSARFGHSAFAVDSKMYLYGGQGLVLSSNDGDGTSVSPNNQNNQQDFECFSSLHCLDVKTMTWSQVDSSSRKVWPKRRNSHSVALLGSNSLVLFGGANEVDGPTNDLWKYDIKSNEWTKIKALGDGSKSPCAREMHTLCGDVENNCVYLLGGRKEDGSVCQDLWVHHFNDRKWTELECPPIHICAHATTIVQGRIVTFGGWDGMRTIFNDIISYDTQTNSWTIVEASKENNNVPRFAHCAGTLPDDIILVAGGVNASSDLSDMILIKRIQD